MNMKSVKSFIITLVLSILLFEGIEHLLEELFNINLNHYLSGFGLGAVVLWGFKLHIICCVVPAAFSALVAHRKQEHCDHCDHDK